MMDVRISPYADDKRNKERIKTTHTKQVTSWMCTKQHWERQLKGVTEITNMFGMFKHTFIHTFFIFKFPFRYFFYSE